MVFFVLRLLLCLYFLLFLLFFFFFILVITLTSSRVLILILVLVLIFVRLWFLVYVGEELIDLLPSLLIVITSWRSHTFHLLLT